MDAEGENAKGLLPAFTHATGIRVDLQWLAWSAAHEKLLTAFAGGSLPDVLMLARQWVAEFTIIGAIAPLPADQSSLLHDVFAPHDLRIDGRDMGVPWTMDTSAQYYRRDLLTRAGYDTPEGSWESWLTMLRAVKRVQEDRYALLMQLNYPDHLLQIASQQSDPLLRDQQSRSNFNSPGFKAALRFYKTLFDEELAPRATSVEVADPVSELARGWVAVYPAGSWIRAELLRRHNIVSPDLWATAPMPGSVQRGARISGAVLCVSASARDPSKAWALIRHLTSPQTELQLTGIAGTLPSRPSAWTALSHYSSLRPFHAALERPMPSYNLLEWERISSAIQLISEQVVRGRLTIDEAVVELNSRVDAILAKRRWLLDRGRIA